LYPEKAGLPVILPLWLLVFSASSQTMIVAPILPQAGAELALPDSVLGTLVSAYTLMVGLCAVLCGPVSDRVGRRRILLLGAGMMTVALTAHLFISGYWSFLAARTFAGVAGGVLSGAAVAYVGDYFPYEKRGWATGWVMSGSAFGQILGIPVGVLLAGALGLKAPFLAFALVMGLTFSLLWWRVPHAPVEARPGPLSLAAAVSHYREILRIREVLFGASAFFLLSAGISLFVVYLPTWLEGSLGATPGQIGLLFFLGGLGSIVAGPGAGRLSDRIGRRGIILWSCIGLALVMVLIPLLVRRVELAYPLFFVAMLLMGMRVGPFSAMLTTLAPGPKRGALMSLTVALGQVGYSVGGGIAGPLYAHWGYFSDTLLGAVAVLGMGLVVWCRLPEPKPAREVSSRARWAPRPSPSGRCGR
jgi:predicted MFS family arabinose efflux permease